MGIRAPKRVTVAQETPASLGVHGPGEITIFSGWSASISSNVILLLRNTFTSAPSSLR
jgi:hypothetical protein